jgi:hypothetical protein
MGILDAPVERLAKATLTTGDLGGAGEAPTSVSQGNSVCPECGRKGGKHKKGCRCIGEKEVGLTKSTPADKTPEPFSSSKTSNWVAKAGGLPNYVQHVAHALVRKGKPESAAIRMAIGIIKNWAEGKGDVSDAVRVAAGKALAQWEKMKAGTHVSKAMSDEVDSVSLDDPDVVWAMEQAGVAVELKTLHKSLFTPVEKRFNPRQPRDPHTGQWISVGGVVPKETELAHRAVGEDIAASPIGGHYYELGKKIQRGETLTRKERGIAKWHVKNELKKPSELSSTRYRRYRDFAKVHGMNLKTKTKGKHPGKQVGNPGALRGAIVETIPIREPDPAMERQRAEERRAEREG